MGGIDESPRQRAKGEQSQEPLISGRSSRFVLS